MSPVNGGGEGFVSINHGGTQKGFQYTNLLLSTCDSDFAQEPACPFLPPHTDFAALFAQSYSHGDGGATTLSSHGKHPKRA